MTTALPISIALVGGVLQYKTPRSYAQGNMKTTRSVNSYYHAQVPYLT